MILLLIPPIYGIWLFELGNILLTKTHKNNTFFKIVTITTIFLFAICCIIPFILWYYNYSLRPEENGTLIILICTSFFWLLTLAMLSEISVNFDRSFHKDRFYSLADKIDYIRRFFEFLIWPYNIWNLQEIIQDKYL